jgi:hypothetical protein
MMCDLIRGIQIALCEYEFRYIGMGAKYFEDFLVFHNEFGIQDMISIESRKDARDRYEFNKPLKTIEMKYGKTTAVLPQLNYQDKRNLVWLDYDDLFSEDIVRDIGILMNKLSVGDIFFISFNYFFEGKTQNERKKKFEERIDNSSDPNERQENFSTKSLPLVIKRIIDKTINNTLLYRNSDMSSADEIQYRQLMFLTYKDGIPMLTIGGILVNEEMDKLLQDNINYENYRFLKTDNEATAFEIKIPTLTEKEIKYILQKIPVSEAAYNASSEEFYGISFSEVQLFETIHRYYPYYVESRMHN